MAETDGIQEAKKRIAKVIAEGGEDLDLIDLDLTSLDPLAEDLAQAISVKTLELDRNPITDITPLAGMTGLTRLDLRNTQITDLTPIAGITGIKTLDLSDTQVTDMRPIRDLTLLVEGLHLFTDGLQFKNTPACTLDPKIAEIAEVQDHTDRARQLFAYLEDWVLPEEDGRDIHVSDDGKDDLTGIDPDIPPRRVAPLEVTITDNAIRMANRDGLPASDANERARMGWEALKEYRQDFAADFNPSNYSPLPQRLDAFDRVMGEEYDPKNVIRIGIQAQRLARLSENKEFMQNLPTGAGDDLRDFAEALIVYVERFPDWNAYKNRDDDLEVDVKDPSVSEQIDAIAGALETTTGVEKAVAEEYRAEFEESQATDAGDVEKKAIVTTTTEMPKELVEYHLEQKRIHKRKVKELADAGADLIDGAVKGPIGVPIQLTRAAGKPLCDLHDRGFPGLGWFVRWYENHFDRETDDQSDER